MLFSLVCIMVLAKTTECSHSRFTKHSNKKRLLESSNESSESKVRAKLRAMQTSSRTDMMETEGSFDHEIYLTGEDFDDLIYGYKEPTSDSLISDLGTLSKLTGSRLVVARDFLAELSRNQLQKLFSFAQHQSTTMEMLQCVISQPSLFPTVLFRIYKGEYHTVTAASMTQDLIASIRMLSKGQRNDLVRTIQEEIEDRGKVLAILAEYTKTITYAADLIDFEQSLLPKWYLSDSSFRIDDKTDDDTLFLDTDDSKF